MSFEKERSNSTCKNLVWSRVQGKERKYGEKIVTTEEKTWFKAGGPMVHILIQSETISGNKWIKRPQRVHIQHFAQLVGCGWVGLHRGFLEIDSVFLM